MIKRDNFSVIKRTLNEHGILFSCCKRNGSQKIEVHFEEEDGCQCAYSIRGGKNSYDITVDEVSFPMLENKMTFKINEGIFYGDVSECIDFIIKKTNKMNKKEKQLKEFDALYAKDKDWKESAKELKAELKELIKNIDKDEYKDGVELLNKVIGKLNSWKGKISKFID